MILFTVLLVMALTFLLLSVGALIFLGAGFAIVFGDLIICMLLISLICKLFSKKKKSSKKEK